MNETIPTYDAIVLGAGAAGLMCAYTAGARGRKVLLIEHNKTVGEKIRISGGGRCNFTNLQTEPARYHSQNPRFCYSALARYTPEDFIAFVERHNISYHERTLGQLFCDESAKQIVDAFLEECAMAGVDLKTGCTVQEVRKTDQFVVETSHGSFRAPALVVATGGLSIPKMGATDFGHRLAEQFDVPLVPRTPGLVPFTVREEQKLGLPGVSFNAEVSTGKVTFEESVLFTHRGLSGPAILQASSFWKPGTPITVDLFPGTRLEDELMQAKQRKPKTFPKQFLSAHLAGQFALWFCDTYQWNRCFGEMSDSAVRAMAVALQHWEIQPAGTEGYAKAEVTCGGVDTKALSPKTMETRKTAGLFFIGEVMDVTGWLGGYNFQWAWASATAAGNAV